MKALARALCILSIAALPISAAAQQYFSYTGVRRLVKFRILPGKTADFYKYAAAVSKALEAEKSAGIITGYQMLHSTTFLGLDKFDVAFVISYKDMASLDSLSDKTEPVLMKSYGTPENRAAMGKLADGSCEEVSSELLRDIAVKAQ